MIEDIAVDAEQARHRRVQRLMQQAALDEEKGLLALRLETQSNNVAACRFICARVSCSAASTGTYTKGCPPARGRQPCSSTVFSKIRARRLPRLSTRMPKA